MYTQLVHVPHRQTLLQWQGLQLLPGLHAVVGDEGCGKTRLLRTLADEVPDGLWLDPRLEVHDDLTPTQVWQHTRQSHPAWREALCQDLCEALGLQEHLGKQLFMLSTGSRRKVALIALAASGAQITCISHPYAALDLASVQVLREFLSCMADDPGRAWLIEDHEADAQLAWASTISVS